MKRKARSRSIGAPQRLTPDVLPYAGYGIQTRGEYAATLSFLRAVKRGDLPAAVYAAQGAPIASNEYMGAVAAIRGGLVRGELGGGYRLTDYGRVYLAQRETA